jgi:hypothetical protein
MHLTRCFVGLLACVTFGLARKSKGESFLNELAANDEDATQFDRIDIPLTFDKGGRYVAGITMVGLHIYTSSVPKILKCNSLKDHRDKTSASLLLPAQV